MAPSNTTLKQTYKAREDHAALMALSPDQQRIQLATYDVPRLQLISEYMSLGKTATRKEILIDNIVTRLALKGSLVSFPKRPAPAENASSSALPSKRANKENDPVKSAGTSSAAAFQPAATTSKSSVAVPSLSLTVVKEDKPVKTDKAGSSASAPVASAIAQPVASTSKPAKEGKVVKKAAKPVSDADSDSDPESDGESESTKFVTITNEDGTEVEVEISPLPFLNNKTYFCGARAAKCEYNTPSEIRSKPFKSTSKMRKGEIYYVDVDAGKRKVQAHMRTCRVVHAESGPVSNHSRFYKPELHDNMPKPNKTHCKWAKNGCDYHTWGPTHAIVTGRANAHASQACPVMDTPPVFCEICVDFIPKHKWLYHTASCGKWIECHVCKAPLKGTHSLVKHQTQHCPDHPLYFSRPVTCGECKVVFRGTNDVLGHRCGSEKDRAGSRESSLARELDELQITYAKQNSLAVPKHGDEGTLTTARPDFTLTKFRFHLPSDVLVLLECDEFAHKGNGAESKFALGIQADSSRARRIFSMLDPAQYTKLVFVRVNPDRYSRDGHNYAGPHLAARVQAIESWLSRLSFDKLADGYHLAYFYYPIDCKSDLVELSKPYFDAASKDKIIKVHSPRE